jgi:hypothetical protein
MEVTVKTFSEVAESAPPSPYPHYDGGTLRRLRAQALTWRDSGFFGPGITDKLDTLLVADIVCKGNLPLSITSPILGNVSWLEDCTLLSIAPDVNWSEDLPIVMQALPHDFTVLRSTNKPDDNRCNILLQAKVYDPTKPLNSKQRADINRAVSSLVDVTVSFDGSPSDEHLLQGVRRWNRHGYSGDYFLWQWMWVKVAGKTVHIVGPGYEAWAGLVCYGDFNVFTAYHTTGDVPSGIGTAILNLLLVTHGKKVPTVLTIPLTEDQERRFGVSKYETYKRRFANDFYTLGCYQGLVPFDRASPPYFDVVSQMEITRE